MTYVWQQNEDDVGEGFLQVTQGGVDVSSGRF